MTDTTWTIDGIVVDGVTTPPSAITRGQTTTVDVVFDGDSVAVRDAYERYQDLLSYLEYSGEDTVHYGTSNEGVPWFREQIPESAPVDTLLVDVVPGDDVIEPRGFWGLLVSGSDESVPIGEFRRVNLELVMLAPLEEFDSKQSVRDAYESTVF